MRKLFVIGDVILEKDFSFYFFCIVMPQIQSVGAYIFYISVRPSVCTLCVRNSSYTNKGIMNKLTQMVNLNV